MSRTEPITRLEVAACPMHRDEVKHYARTRSAATA